MAPARGQHHKYPAIWDQGRVTSDPLFNWPFPTHKLVQHGSFGSEELLEKTVKVPRLEEDCIPDDKHIDQIITNPPALYTAVHFENAFANEDASNSSTSPDRCTSSRLQESSIMSWSQNLELGPPPPGTPITSLSNNMGLDSLPPLPNSPVISFSEDLESEPSPSLEDGPVMSWSQHPEPQPPPPLENPQKTSPSVDLGLDTLPPLPDSPVIPPSDDPKPESSDPPPEDSSGMTMSNTKRPEPRLFISQSKNLELELRLPFKDSPIISMLNHMEPEPPPPPPPPLLDSFPPPLKIHPLPFENYPSRLEPDVTTKQSSGILRYYSDEGDFDGDEDWDEGSNNGKIDIEGSENSDILPPPPPAPGPGPGPGPSINPRERSPTQTPLKRTDSFGRVWARIKALRAEVWDKRSKIQASRKVLREKQLAKSTADDKYFQYIRKQSLGVILSSQNVEQEDMTLLQLYDECERLRNEYGPMEDDCNLLENELGIQEFELQKLEERFYERPVETIGVVEPAPIFLEPRETPSASSISSMDSENEAENPYHPLVSQYLEKVGDVNILRERLEWNIEERYRLEEERETRARVNMELQEPDKQWLDEYPVTELELINQLDQETEKADSLRHQCFSLGLIDEDGDPTDFEAQAHHAFTDFDDNVDAGNELSTYVKFPELLPLPWTKEVQLRNAGYLPPQITPASEDDRINLWLLHQMCMSPLQIHLLASIFDLLIKQRQDPRWETNVLPFWFRDGTSEKLHDPDASTGVMTQAPQTGAGFLSVQSESRSFGVIIPSSLLSPPGKAFVASKAEPAIQELNMSYGDFIDAPTSERVLGHV